MSEVEKKCECGETNVVAKSFNCTKCGVWNKFEVKEESDSKDKVKKGKKGWLS